MAFVDVDEPRQADEAYRVHAWRVDQIHRLGYGAATAERIASSDADVHQLEHLIRDLRCPRRLAARIVE